MNTEIKIQNRYTQTQTAMHRRRCIAAFIYERTKHSKRTTCREICAAYKYHHGVVNSLLQLMQREPSETTHGPVIVVPMGKRTDTGGVTAQTYAAILQPLKSAQ